MTAIKYILPFLLALLLCAVFSQASFAGIPVPKKKPKGTTKNVAVQKTVANAKLPIPKRKPAYFAGVTPKGMEIKWRKPYQTKQNDDVAPIEQVVAPEPAPKFVGGVKVREANGKSPITIPGLPAAIAPSAPSRMEADSQGVPDPALVFFKEDSLELEPEQTLVLDQDVVAVMRARDNLRVTITTFAEKSGGPDLAEKRARGLGSYLAGKGVATSRIYLNAQGSNTKISPRDRAEFNFRRR